MTIENVNRLGAIAAHVIYVSSICTFTARLAGQAWLGLWLGLPLLATAVPLGYLLIRAATDARPLLYYIQVSLMLAWTVALFILDYALKVDFRDRKLPVIAFVVSYFAATGGMLGVAACAGRAWIISGSVLFLAAAILAFAQRL